MADCENAKSCEVRYFKVIDDTRAFHRSMPLADARAKKRTKKRGTVEITEAYGPNSTVPNAGKLNKVNEQDDAKEAVFAKLNDIVNKRSIDVEPLCDGPCKCSARGANDDDWDGDEAFEHAETRFEIIEYTDVSDGWKYHWEFKVTYKMKSVDIEGRCADPSKSISFEVPEEMLIAMRKRPRKTTRKKKTA